MTTERAAELLARWLDEPAAEPPPQDVDADVLEAVFALRPERAPAPRVHIDDILDTVESGPLAAFDEAEAAEAAALAAALDGDGDAPDAALDALYALRPSMAPAPRLNIDDLLDSVGAGPFVARPAGANQPPDVEAANQPMGAFGSTRRRFAVAWAGLGAIAMAAMAMVLVIPASKDLPQGFPTAGSSRDEAPMVEAAPALSAAPSLKASPTREAGSLPEAEQSETEQPRPSEDLFGAGSAPAENKPDSSIVADPTKGSTASGGSGVAQQLGATGRVSNDALADGDSFRWLHDEQRQQVAAAPTDAPATAPPPPPSPPMEASATQKDRKNLESITSTAELKKEKASVLAELDEEEANGQSRRAKSEPVAVPTTATAAVTTPPAPSPAKAAKPARAPSSRSAASAPAAAESGYYDAAPMLSGAAGDANLADDDADSVPEVVGRDRSGPRTVPAGIGSGAASRDPGPRQDTSGNTFAPTGITGDAAADTVLSSADASRAAGNNAAAEALLLPLMGSLNHDVVAQAAWRLGNIRLAAGHLDEALATVDKGIAVAYGAPLARLQNLRAEILSAKATKRAFDADTTIPEIK